MIFTASSAAITEQYHLNSAGKLVLLVTTVIIPAVFLASLITSISPLFRFDSRQVIVHTVASVVLWGRIMDARDARDAFVFLMRLLSRIYALADSRIKNQ